MATRRTKKDATSASGGGEAKKPARRRTTSARTARARSRAAADELDAVGADIVPTVPIEVTTEGPSTADREPSTLLDEWDFHLFNEGTHHKLWHKLGSHIVPGGVIFGVWAPNAARVSVIGDFNDWNRDGHPLERRGGSGIWEGFIPGVAKGTVYKYHIVSQHNGYRVDKADPFAVR